jgi:hypothetical protein
MSDAVGARRALIVVDVQNDYDQGGALEIAYPPFSQTLENIGLAMDAAREQGVKVVVITPAGGIKTNMVQIQVDGLKADFEALSDENKERYGYLFDGYGKFSSRSLAATAFPPEKVTEVVFEAFDAEEPETRYLAGDGDIITLLTSMTDQQRDDCFATLFEEGSTFTSRRIREFLAAQ